MNTRIRIQKEKEVPLSGPPPRILYPTEVGGLVGAARALLDDRRRGAAELLRVDGARVDLAAARALAADGRDGRGVMRAAGGEHRGGGARLVLVEHVCLLERDRAGCSAVHEQYRS
jgi:hypothetical protein